MNFMRAHILLTLTLFLLLSAICSAVEKSDSTFIYLNTGLVVKFKIAEIHIWGFRDDGGRPVNFKNIDSIKTCNEKLVSELRNSYQSIIIRNLDNFYLLDFSKFNPNEFQIREYNKYLELLNSGQKPPLSTGKFIGQTMFGTLTGLIAATPFIAIANSEQNLGEGIFVGFLLLVRISLAAPGVFIQSEMIRKPLVHLPHV